MGKNLKLAVCVDDSGGMLFAGKRQSRDRVLISELVDTTDGHIYVTGFSEYLFREHERKVRVVDNPFATAPDGATIFIENLDISPHEDLIGEILLYKWNERYPADKIIDINLRDYRVVAKKEFAGSSHEKITKLRLKR